MSPYQTKKTGLSSHAVLYMKLIDWFYKSLSIITYKTSLCFFLL